MTCVTCRNLQSGPMTTHGLNTCKLGTNYEYWPLGHKCEKHSPEAPDKQAVRESWIFKHVR